MKKILLLSSLFLFVIKGSSQIIADPAVQNMFARTVINSTIDENFLPLNFIFVLKVPILNKNLLNALPIGTCKIKIGLGSKLILDPNFNLSNTNTSEYFNWTATSEGGQVQLTADLKSSLPSKYDSICEFRVRGSLLGSSTITTNFLITNHNTTIILSDENPSNNSASLAYTIVEPEGGVTPVTFTGLVVKKELCNINVDFSTENEINVKEFEIETSKNGRDYKTVGKLVAEKRGNYAFSFLLTQENRAAIIYVRVKSVDLDGRYQYTPTKTIKGICLEKLIVSLYPNPTSKNNTEVTLRANSGNFNGKVALSLLDINGKILSLQELNLINAEQLKFKTGLLAAGQYIIQVTGNEIDTPVLLRFQQL